MKGRMRNGRWWKNKKWKKKQDWKELMTQSLINQFYPKYSLSFDKYLAFLLKYIKIFTFDWKSTSMSLSLSVISSIGINTGVRGWALVYLGSSPGAASFCSKYIFF